MSDKFMLIEDSDNKTKSVGSNSRVMKEPLFLFYLDE